MMRLRNLVLVMLAGCMVFGLSHLGLADPLTPAVLLSPNLTQALKLEVGPAQGDYSWIWHEIRTPEGNDPLAEYNTVVLSFDIYRQNGPLQTLSWWAGSEYSPEAADPASGWQGEDTLPFGAGTSGTAVKQYANIRFQWDFKHSMAYSMYNGALIDSIGLSGFTQFPGWLIKLSHEGPSGASDVVWIDNLKVSAWKDTDPDLYEFDFETFNVGPLAGQEGWLAGTYTAPVPEPASLLFLGIGLLGLTWFKRKV